jgi:LPS sulfotransferase NodH
MRIFALIIADFDAQHEDTSSEAELRVMDDHFRDEFVAHLKRESDIFALIDNQTDLFKRKPDGRYELDTIEGSYQAWLEINGV